MGGYTVFDVETTGLFPEHTDRVLELGIAYGSHAGDIQGHWPTTINPCRAGGASIKPLADITWPDLHPKSRPRMLRLAPPP